VAEGVRGKSVGRRDASAVGAERRSYVDVRCRA
jgi:hypothetical protein